MNTQDLRKKPHVYLLTEQGGKFRIAHDSIKELAREALFTFTPDGVELAGQDSAGTVLVRYVMKAEDIRSTGGIYECTVPSLKVGINTRYFATNLKSVSPSDSWSLAVDVEKPDRLFMTTSNKASHKTMCWEMNSIDMKDEDLLHEKLENYGYTCMIMYPATAFHDMMRDLGNSENNIARICCDGKRLVIYSAGTLNRIYFEIEDSTEPVSATSTSATTAVSACAEDDPPPEKKQKRAEGRFIFDVKDKSPECWPFCDSYHLKVLQRATKAKGFSSLVKIYIKRVVPDGFLISLCYDNLLGTLQFFIGPHEDESWGKYEDRKMPDRIGVTAPVTAAAGSEAKQEKEEEEQSEDEEDDASSSSSSDSE